MRPLVYLTVRTVLNGIKRAFKSGRRLISLILFLGWYIFAFIRPFDHADRFASESPVSFNVPSNTVIEAFVFAIFSLLTLLLMMGVFSYRGNFKPADVDVLFATPVSPRLVLMFRIIRDYLFTLLLPLFMAIFFYRPASIGLAGFFSKNPRASVYAGKVSMVAWLLMALFWVCGGYALSLWVNRSDLQSERNRKVLGVTLSVVIVSVVGFIGYSIRNMQSPDDLVTLTQAPFLRSVFFTSTLATQMVVGSLTGTFGPVLLAGGAFLCAIVASLYASFAQAQWMYDQAASRGTDAQTLRSLQRQGDIIGMTAERARSGKVRVKRVTWFQRLRVRGVWAVVWKEILILMRSSTTQFALMVPVVLALVVIPVIGLGLSGTRLDKVLGPMFMAMEGMGVFILAISLSQSGFIEMLRRVDLQKPLPFTPAQIVTAEVMAKVLPTSIVSWFATIIAVAFDPALWSEGIAASIGIPFSAALVSGIVLLMTVLFPDIDDPAQRSLRGFLTMIGLLIAAAPCVLVYALIASISSPIIGAIVASALAAGIFAGVTAVAGGLYASFNPSE